MLASPLCALGPLLSKIRVLRTRHCGTQTVHLITQAAIIKWLAVRHVHSVDALDKGMAHVLSWAEWDGAGLDLATQDSVPFKTDELFISGIFHLIFSDHRG